MLSLCCPCFEVQHTDHPVTSVAVVQLTLWKYTMEVVEMVLGGCVNKSLVSLSPYHLVATY
jgi:acetylglutamate kinase